MDDHSASRRVDVLEEEAPHLIADEPRSYDYTATVEKNLLNGEWVIRVRCVAAKTMGGRNQYESFVLVPDHQGEMFSVVCDKIEPAIDAYSETNRTIEQGGLK